MNVRPELKETMLKLNNKRSNIGRLVGTGRVDIRNVDNIMHEAKTEGVTIIIDEPVERGGTNKGLHPLGHFIVGIAACFMNQFVRISVIKDLNIDTVKMIMRAHWDRKTREFIDMIFDVKITGSESNETAIALLNEAEERCIAHQTLKKAIPLISNLNYNGKKITSISHKPE